MQRTNIQLPDEACAFTLNPSPAMRFAYSNSACLYSSRLYSAYAANSLLSRCPSVTAAAHHAGGAFSARAPAGVRFVRSAIAPSSGARGAHPACVLAPCCCPCHASEAFSNHGSLSFVHAQSAASYDCASTSESWITGMPCGRTAVERMVKLDEGPRIGMTDVGGIDLFLDVLEFTMNT